MDQKKFFGRYAMIDTLSFMHGNTKSSTTVDEDSYLRPCESDSDSVDGRNIVSNSRKRKVLKKILTFYKDKKKTKRPKTAVKAGHFDSKTSPRNRKFKLIKEPSENVSSKKSSVVNKYSKSNVNKGHSAAIVASISDANYKLGEASTSKEFNLSDNISAQIDAESTQSISSECSLIPSNAIANVGHNQKVPCSNKKQTTTIPKNKEIIEGNFITYIMFKPEVFTKTRSDKRKVKFCEDLDTELSVSSSSESGLNSTRLDKKARLSLNTRKRKQSNRISDEFCLEKLFHTLKETEFCSKNLKPTIEMLVRNFSNPDCAPNVSKLLYHTLNYLHDSEKNHLLTFSDSSARLPFDENCIVKAFFIVESKHLPHMSGLLRSAVTTIQHLILTKKGFGVYGLASLCRVLAEVCRCQNCPLKPVILCSDLLKLKHAFGPYLIASIVAVWKKPFQAVNNLPAEEVLFYSSILYGASQKPLPLKDCAWNCSVKVVSKCFTAPPVNDARKAITDLKNFIQFRCTNNSWNSHYLTSALVILASTEDWEWIQEHLLAEFILPGLQKFGLKTLNQNAFGIFCNLYVDVFLLKPGDSRDKVLTYFISSESIVGNFVKESAALALARYVYLKNMSLPSSLTSWLEHNQQRPKALLIKSLFEKKKVDCDTFHLEDIL